MNLAEHLAKMVRESEWWEDPYKLIAQFIHENYVPREGGNEHD